MPPTPTPTLIKTRRSRQPTNLTNLRRSPRRSTQHKTKESALKNPMAKRGGRKSLSMLNRTELAPNLAPTGAGVASLTSGKENNLVDGTTDAKDPATGDCKGSPGDGVTCTESDPFDDGASDVSTPTANAKVVVDASTQAGAPSIPTAPKVKVEDIETGEEKAEMSGSNVSVEAPGDNQPAKPVALAKVKVEEGNGQGDDPSIPTAPKVKIEEQIEADQENASMVGSNVSIEAPGDQQPAQPFASAKIKVEEVDGQGDEAVDGSYLSVEFRIEEVDGQENTEPVLDRSNDISAGVSGGKLNEPVPSTSENGAVVKMEEVTGTVDSPLDPEVESLRAKDDSLKEQVKNARSLYDGAYAESRAAKEREKKTHAELKACKKEIKKLRSYVGDVKAKCAEKYSALKQRTKGISKRLISTEAVNKDLATKLSQMESLCNDCVVEKEAWQKIVTPGTLVLVLTLFIARSERCLLFVELGIFICATL